MGFNTAAVILNDSLDAIATDQHIGSRIHESVLTAARLGGSVTAQGERGIHIGAIRILPSQHADSMQIVAIGGNDIRRLAWSNKYEDEDLLRDFADQMGFTLRRKRKIA